MGSIGGNGTGKSRSGGRSISGIDETPHPSQNVVSAGKLNSLREHDSIDSSLSRGSEDNIIRKAVEWDVHYETTLGRAL